MIRDVLEVPPRDRDGRVAIIRRGVSDAIISLTYDEALWLLATALPAAIHHHRKGTTP